MKNTLCFTLILGFVTGVAQAQQLNGSSELTILRGDDLKIQSVLASASTVQVNEITTMQNGNNNLAHLNPQNGENQIRLIQNGNFNSIDLQVYGEGNNYQFSQIGNRNDLQIRNLEATNNTLQIVQKGDGNQLIDNGSGTFNRPLRIEQTGGMKIMINGQF